MSDNPLALVPIMALINELNRRCASLAVACQYFEEDSDAETPTTTSVIEGNFVHINGLICLLKTRADMLTQEKLFGSQKPEEDDDEPD